VRALPISFRVVRGTVFVALITALAGAATASLIARGLWRAHERRALVDLAGGLEQAVRRESGEEGTTLEVAAAEALRESVTAGHRAEVWKGGVLVASVPAGPPLRVAGGQTRQEARLVETRPLPGGLTLYVAAPPERAAEVLRVFGWSLLLSLPVSLALAVLIGRLVGRRAARPLLDFRGRLAAARPFDALPPAPPPAVVEVAEIEASFRGLWESLREAMRREAEFAANAAHELRTPLTRIRLGAERARSAAGPGARRDLDALIEEIDRVVRLVDSLLILARETAPGPPEGETINLSDLLAATARRVFAGATPPRIDAPDEALVRGDEALLGVAIENLLDNARKFSAGGGPPHVALNEDGKVRLTVTSPRARVPRAQAERLFERFYRGAEARASFAGHGLGLPLARHVARLHGGDVLCVSAPDEDACFELWLPAWRPAPAERPRSTAGG
jgi:two-component system OmpR family sensor kinase